MLARKTRVTRWRTATPNGIDCSDRNATRSFAKTARNRRTAVRCSTNAAPEHTAARAALSRSFPPLRNTTAATAGRALRVRCRMQSAHARITNSSSRAPKCTAANAAAIWDTSSATGRLRRTFAIASTAWRSCSLRAERHKRRLPFDRARLHRGSAVLVRRPNAGRENDCKQHDEVVRQAELHEPRHSELVEGRGSTGSPRRALSYHECGDSL